MNISTFDPSKITEIQHLFTQTFSDSEGQSEGLLIGNIVFDLVTSTNTQDLYGFVAIESEAIVGGIFFSRLVFQSKVNAFLLSPVAIRTSCQGKGTGQKLINYGLKSIREDGVELVFTYGDPGYYAKVGFSSISEKLVRAPLKLTQPEGWLGQSLVSDAIKPIAGNSLCVDALNRPDIW